MNRFWVRGSFAIETEGRKEGRREGWRKGGREEVEEERGTYNAPVRAVGEATGQYCNYRETECGPPKGFDGLKFAAPARMNVSAKFVRSWT